VLEACKMLRSEDAAEEAVDIRAQALQAMLTGAANLQLLRTLGEKWGRSCLDDSGRGRDGLVLVTAVAGLSGGKLPGFMLSENSARLSRAPAVDEALTGLLGEAQLEAPPRGTLASLPAMAARQVTMRLNHFFTAAGSLLGTAAGFEGKGEAGTGQKPGSAFALLSSLVIWLIALAGGTPLRALRQAATAAGLGLLQALNQELTIAQTACGELEKQLSVLQARGDQEHVDKARQAAKAARLCRGCADARRVVACLEEQRDALRDGLLMPRLRDAAPSVRRLALNALARLLQTDPRSYASAPWPQRFLRATCDPSVEVRLRAVELVAQCLTKQSKAASAADQEGEASEEKQMEAADANGLGLRALAPQIVLLLVERAKDVEPRVAAAAVRGLRLPHLATALSDEDFAIVACLPFNVPETHAACRVEAALFVDEHLLPEPGLGAAAKEVRAAKSRQSDEADCAAKEPDRKHEAEGAMGVEGDAVEGHFGTEHGLMSLIDFLTNYLAADQLHLSSRFVRALWGRADCLSRWSSIADLCLVGEGRGAARAIPALSGRQRLALLYVLEASLACAAAEAEMCARLSHRMDAAVDVLVPRLPRLFELVGAEQEAMAALALIARRLLRHTCQGAAVADENIQADGNSGPPRTVLASLLRLLTCREVPWQPRTALHLADGLAALKQRSREVQSACRNLAAELCKACDGLLPKALPTFGNVRTALLPADAELAAVLTPLLALGQRGIDIWSCNESQSSANHLLQGAILLLEMRSNLSGRGAKSTVSSSAAAWILELLLSLLAWRAREEAGVGKAGAKPGAKHEVPVESKTGFLLCCTYVRVCCAGLLSEEKNIVLRLQALSTYLAVLQLQLAGSDAEEPRNGAAEAGFPRVPEEHAAAVDAALASFFKQCPTLTQPVAPTGRVSAAGWKVPLPNAEGMVLTDTPLTACRWLVERHFAWEVGGTDVIMEEEAELVAVVASRMIAECEHEAIFAGLPAQRLLRQLAKESPAGASDARGQVQEAASALVKRLRRLGGRSTVEAARGYEVLFAAAAQQAEEAGIDSGLRLAEVLLLSAGNPIVPGSRAAARLGKGLAAALRKHGLEVAQAMQATTSRKSLEVLVPWLRDPCCPLQASAARELAGTLAAAFGLLAPKKAPQKVPGGAWALVHALQVRGSSSLKRSVSWRAKMQEKARKRLRKGLCRRPAATPEAAADKGPVGAAAPTGWLPSLRGKAGGAPVEKAEPASKRRRLEQPKGRECQVQAAQAKRRQRVENPVRECEAVKVSSDAAVAAPRRQWRLRAGACP